MDHIHVSGYSRTETRRGSETYSIICNCRTDSDIAIWVGIRKWIACCGSNKS